MLEIRAYQQADVWDMAGVWNEVVENGIAFPQEEALDAESAAAFFADQTHCGVAVEDERVVGLYILHPNNVGRCGHIANASYAVESAARGKGVGRMLVDNSLAKAKEHDFRVMQFLHRSPCPRKGACVNVVTHFDALLFISFLVRSFPPGPAPSVSPSE